MIYENTNDTEQERIVFFQYTRHLTALGCGPVSIEMEDKRDLLPWDGKLFVHGKWTAVIEVKSRDFDSDTLKKWGTMMIETKDVVKLARQFYKESSATGRKYWNKEVIFLFRLKKDDTAYAINMRRIQELWDELEDMPEGSVKDDHGKKPTNRKAKLIPYQSLERVE